MANSSSDSPNIDTLLRVFEQSANSLLLPSPVPVKPELQEQWMNNSIFFPQIAQNISSNSHQQLTKLAFIFF